MKVDQIQIQSANELDMLVIEKQAKLLDLDCEDFKTEQFIVAKGSTQILGFGRLRTYAECIEIATVGVIESHQKKGLGSLIVKELISRGPSEIYLTCVIPDFFNNLGFQLVKQYPSVLQKKVDFCKSYNYRDDQVFVMKLIK
jgi:N-acetylglutamate synthase-like GNAT family acetyltransferase